MLILMFASLALLAEDTDVTNKIQVTEIEAFDYAALEASGSYDQHSASSIRLQVCRAFQWMEFLSVFTITVLLMSLKIH